MSKPNQLIDAVKTAISIHNGDYSSLRGKSFVISDNIEKNKGQDKNVNKPKSKYTLNQIGDLVVGLSNDIKKVNDRIDRIDARLDYIVKTNNLKDSK